MTAALTGPTAAEATSEWFWRAEIIGGGDRARVGKSAVALVELKPGRNLAGDPFRDPEEYGRFTVSDAFTLPIQEQECARRTCGGEVIPSRPDW